MSRTKEEREQELRISREEGQAKMEGANEALAKLVEPFDREHG